MRHTCRPSTVARRRQRGLTALIATGLAIVLVARPAGARAQTIFDAVQSALTTSPGINSQRLQVDAQRERRGIALSQRRATIQGEASAGVAGRTTRQQSFFGTSESEYQSTEPLSAGITIEQPLYTGGRASAALQTVEVQIRQSEERLRGAEAELIRSVVSAWAQVRRDLAIVAERGAAISAIQELLAGARERFRLGEGTLTDVAQAEARLAAETAALAVARAELAASQAAFTRFVGDASPGPTDVGPLPPLPATLADAIEISRWVNPELLLARLEQSLGEARRREIETEYNGRLVLQAGVSSTTDQGFPGNRSNSGQLTARYTVPLWSGGQSTSRQREAARLVDAARARALETERQVAEEVTGAWARLEAARVGIEASAQQVEAATTALRGARAEFLLGLRDQLAVLNQQAELSSARINQITAEHDRLVAHYTVFAAIGSLDASSFDAHPEPSGLPNRSGPALWERPIMTVQEALDAHARSIERSRRRLQQRVIGAER